jgi:hypothetical protein
MPLVSARVSPQTKVAFVALAKSRGITESKLLTLLVDTVLEQNPMHSAPGREASDEHAGAATERLSLRLRPGDRSLIDARAGARNMKPASYLVALIRAHVRGGAPLPTAELNTLKVAVGELSAIGRNLNQLARLANTGQGLGASLGNELRETQVRVEDVRRYVADLVRVNLMSWEAGDA